MPPGSPGRRNGDSQAGTGTRRRAGDPATGSSRVGGTRRPASGNAGCPTPVRDTGKPLMFYDDEWRGQEGLDKEGNPMSRASSAGECAKGQSKGCESPELGMSKPDQTLDLFHVIEQLAAGEAALWNILDALKSNATHTSFFCREYWGTSASHAQLSLDRINFSERLKRQVQQACVLESLALGVAAHLCSGTMDNVSVTVRSRLRNLLYYIHENGLVLLDLVWQRWNQNPSKKEYPPGHVPENLNLDILIRVKRYRRLRRTEHILALRQHNEMIVNVVRQLVRGAATRRTPLSSRPQTDRGGRSPPQSPTGSMQDSAGILGVVNDILTGRTPLDRLRVPTVRSKILQYMHLTPLLKTDEQDVDCPWPMRDPYNRFGTDTFGQEGPLIWYEPLPPMFPNLEIWPVLPPPPAHDTYTLVLDLDETLVHYYEVDGMGHYGVRPGMHEFLYRMNVIGFESVIWTAGTQDYADWIIDQIDPDRLIVHRLYRQNALPWGPIFIKDLSKLGRDLDRTLIIDNVQENFMLQPGHGIFILPWYDDPNDTSLQGLTPLLEELIETRSSVGECLEKYRDQIPIWAGFDQYSQCHEDYDFAVHEDDDDCGLLPPDDGRDIDCYPSAMGFTVGPYQHQPAPLSKAPLGHPPKDDVPSLLKPPLQQPPTPQQQQFKPQQQLQQQQQQQLKQQEQQRHEQQRQQQLLQQQEQQRQEQQRQEQQRQEQQRQEQQRQEQQFQQQQERERQQQLQQQERERQQQLQQQKQQQQQQQKQQQQQLPPTSPLQAQLPQTQAVSQPQKPQPPPSPSQQFQTPLQQTQPAQQPMTPPHHQQHPSRQPEPVAQRQPPTPPPQLQQVHQPPTPPAQSKAAQVQHTPPQVQHVPHQVQHQQPKGALPPHLHHKVAHAHQAAQKQQMPQVQQPQHQPQHPQHAGVPQHSAALPQHQQHQHQQQHQQHPQQQQHQPPKHGQIATAGGYPGAKTTYADPGQPQGAPLPPQYRPQTQQPQGQQSQVQPPRSFASGVSGPYQQMPRPGQQVYSRGAVGGPHQMPRRS